MSYQVLARKWRPRIFREMVGQEHVLTALINALDKGRLHHAYLFTGTRGVGKTTIARILAKCLNCEVGVSSEPCDQCAACREINEGRFVDLIEVDAASRTKVEDTRELLDNVQYAPTKGRFKVYLIDEVHMLSGHSFNALLKTLEEPPPHVKFLLATTDPQKLPVTILSRCLQFNLKNLPPERIVDHLKNVLEQEDIPCDEAALWHLGRAADGSMRDALSLTDQAIAFGNGQVREAEVQAMLGSIDQRQVYGIVEALADNDAQALLACAANLAEHAPDYSDALASLINLLHRIAIAQVLPDGIDNTFGDREVVLDFAGRLAAEDVQLFYQTALLGRRDLPLAPDPRGGFEMVLLRMLAFRPPGAGVKPASAPVRRPAQPPADASAKPAEESPPKKPEAPAQPDPVPVEPVEAEAPVEEAEETPAHTSAEIIDADTAEPEPPPGITAPEADPEPAVEKRAEPATPEPQPATTEKAEAEPAEPPPVLLNQLTPESWNTLVEQLPVAGVIQNTLRHCQFLGQEGGTLRFLLDERNSTLYDESHQKRLATMLSDYFGEAINVEIRVGTVQGETPAAAAERRRAEQQAQAMQALQNDPRVQKLVATFSATLNEESVTPLN